MPMQEGMKPQEITPSLANDRREDITRPSLKDSPLGKLLEGEVFNPSDEPRSPYDHERPSLKDSPLGKQLEGEKINPAGTDGPGSSELPSLRNSPLGKSLEKELAQAEDCTPEAGQPVPDGVIMDKDGNPSNDPDDLIKRGGKQLPLAGHKGYALGVAMEILGGIFVGGKGGKHAVPGSDAAFIVAMKKDAFIPAEEYEAKMAAFVDEVKNSTKAPGVDEIRIPGMLGPDYFEMAESDEITILTTIYNDILKYA